MCYRYMDKHGFPGRGEDACCYLARGKTYGRILKDRSADLDYGASISQKNSTQRTKSLFNLLCEQFGLDRDDNKTKLYQVTLEPISYEERVFDVEHADTMKWICCWCCCRDKNNKLNNPNNRVTSFSLAAKFRRKSKQPPPPDTKRPSSPSSNNSSW